MKRLFSVIAFATLVAMCLVSCQQDKVKLHEAVGTVYGPAYGNMGGDGIVFYVDEDAGYALVCSMNDLKYDRMTTNPANAKWDGNFTWSVFGSDTVMERDTIWGWVTRSIRHFVNVTREEYDSIVSGHIDHFVRYIFEEEKRDSAIKIYPMLRYKAYTEKGEPVCPPFTKDTLYNGFIGELIPADSVLRRIDTTSVVLFDSIKKVVEKVIEIPFNGKVKNDTIWRNDTINRRDSITRIDSLYFPVPACYSDTLWNHIKDGDRNILNKENKWDCALDTNWSYSDIQGLGDDGKRNTEIIVNADVPCRQKITPDSSSAARTCYTYYTNNYYTPRNQYNNDTAYKAGQGQWYLPSREELNKLFDARNKINEMNAGTKGFEPLENCYWSSNQKDAKNAWYKCFSDNGVESYIPKANDNYRVNVRAVRKVEWPLK